MALGLILTGAGFSDIAARWWDVAARWWIGAFGLLLVGLVGAKESILWRWRREQLLEELAGQRRRAEQALTDERKRAEQALTTALADERSRRSLVDAHLADRGLPVRRILLLFTIHRSGSTWLFDMLRTSEIPSCFT